MKEFEIVAVSTGTPKEDYYCYEQFFKSLQRYGHNPLMIETNHNKRFSLIDKPKLVKKAIESGVINSRHLLFVDCWDLVFAASPEEVIEKYLTFNSDLVISAEKNCFPSDLKVWYDALPYTSSYRYLNSGMIVGTTESFLETLKAMKVDEIPDDYYDKEKGCNIHFNDQLYYQEIFLKQPVKISLDYNQGLCQTMHDVKLEELDFSGEKIVNKETGSTPLIFHFNGNSKTENGVRVEILNKLKLNASEKRNTN